MYCKVRRKYYVYSPIYGWLSSNASYWKNLKRFEGIIYSQPFEDEINGEKCFCVIASYMCSAGNYLDVFKMCEFHYKEREIV